MAGCEPALVFLRVVKHGSISSSSTIKSVFVLFAAFSNLLINKSRVAEILILSHVIS